MAARVSWSASFPLLSISMTPFCPTSHWTEPDSPGWPPCLVNVERISDTVRLRLSVATSAITATPPAAWPSYRMLSRAAASPPPVAFSIARWMFSRGMFTPRARSMASRSRKFPSGSPPPSFAASMISLVIFVKTTPRFASAAPFWRLIWLHFECPDMARNTINALGGLRPPYPREGAANRTDVGRRRPRPIYAGGVHGVTGAHEDQRCGRRRTWRIGQDESRRVDPPLARGDDAPRQGRRGHEHPGHRPRRAETPHHHQYGARVVLARGHVDQSPPHPGGRRPRRGAPAAARHLWHPGGAPARPNGRAPGPPGDHRPAARAGPAGTQGRRGRAAEGGVRAGRRVPPAARGGDRRNR